MGTDPALSRRAPRGGHIAARARAARAYADKKKGELAAAMGWSESTLGRVEKGAKTLSLEEQADLAGKCGLPADWFAADFRRLSEIAGPPVNGGRPVELLRRLEEVEGRLAVLEAEAEATARTAASGRSSEGPTP